MRRIVEHFFAEDKPVGTLCHGPQVPAALGLLRGRRSSGFPALAPDIELAGGEYVDGAAVVDGSMVSCRGWGDLAEWSRAFLDVLDRAAVPAVAHLTEPSYPLATVEAHLTTTGGSR